MGWMDKALEVLKFRFSNNSPALEIIHLHDLEEWLGVRFQDIIADQRIDKEMVSYLATIKDKRWVIECLLDQWERKIVSLPEPQQREEIHQLFSETRILLDKTTFKKDVKIKELMVINENLSAKIEMLLEKVGESSFANDFEFILSDEEKEMKTTINPLLKELVELDGIRERFEQKIIQSGLRTMDALEQRRQQIILYQEKIDKLLHSIIEKKERLVVAEAKVKEKTEQLHKFKIDHSYDRLSSNQERQSIAIEKMNFHSEEMVCLFTQLKPALEEHIQSDPDNLLVKSYLVNPVKAFSGDENLRINAVLSKLKVMLSEGQLKIPLKDAEKLHNAFVKADLKSLQHLKERYLKIKEEMECARLSGIDRDLLSHIEEIKYRLDHFTKQSQMLKKEISVLDENLANYKEQRSKDKELFQSLVKIGLQKELEIKF